MQIVLRFSKEGLLSVSYFQWTLLEIYESFTRLYRLFFYNNQMSIQKLINAD